MMKGHLLSLITHSLRSLCAQPLRTGLSTLGVIIGVAAVIAMLAVGTGARREILSQIEQLGVDNVLLRSVVLSDEQRDEALSNRSLGLTALDGQLVAKLVSRVQCGVPVKQVSATVQGLQAADLPAILATTAEYAGLKELALREGRFLCDMDATQLRRVCVIGADLFSWQAGVGRTLLLDGQSFEIVGVLRRRDFTDGQISALNDRDPNRSLFIPFGVHRSIEGNAMMCDDAVDEVILQCESGHDPLMTARLVERVMTLTHGSMRDYQLVLPTELMAQAESAQSTFTCVVALLALISLVVGGIGITNIMLATVSERMSEIGIRRAVGATKGQIALQFVSETVLITSVGGLIGLACGMLGSLLINWLTGWSTQITVAAIPAAVGIAICVGLAAGLYPAFRAASVSPVRALGGTL